MAGDSALGGDRVILVRLGHRGLSTMRSEASAEDLEIDC